MSMVSIKNICSMLLDEENQHFYHKTFQRHLDDINTLDENYRFNEKMGQAYILVIQSFKHFKGEKAGQNLILENWQKAVVGVSMGWERKDNKGRWVRRFNVLNIFMARKGGKTLLSAGIALADMIIRPEAQNELVTIATKKDQALIAWKGVFSMIKSHPDLKKLFRKVGNTLYYIKDESTITSLGRDSNSEDGASYGIIILDEYHASADSGLYDVAKSSQGARIQPLSIIISTAGFNLGSPLIPEVEHSRDILNGNIKDETYFAFICEPPEGANPFDIETLAAANPNMNVSVSEEYLLQQAEEAKSRADKLVNYLTKHCNIWVNASEVYIKADDWKKIVKGKDKFRDVSEATRMFIGTDLSISDDFTAVACTYMFDDNHLQSSVKIFIPESDIRERGKRLKAPIETWVSQNHIITTRGNTINYQVVYDHIASLIDDANKLNIEVHHGYDPYKAKSIVARLENDIGFDDNIKVHQGYSTMTEPLALLLTYIKTEQLTVQFNPVMNWMAGNLEIKYDDYGNMKPDKKNPINKIDGIAALINTIYLAIPYIEEEESTSEIFYL